MISCTYQRRSHAAPGLCRRRPGNGSAVAHTGEHRLLLQGTRGSIEACLTPRTHNSAGPRGFLEAIVESRQGAPDYGDGPKAQHVIEAALEAARTQRWIDIAHLT